MTTTTSHETQIILDPDVPLVRIIREFDAPPEKVFRAHADPELFARWCGPDGTRMNVEHMDCRTGGAYRYVMSDDNGEYGFRGCFHDVRPGELIIQTFTFEGEPDGVALEKITFEDLGDGRTRLTPRRSPTPSRAATPSWPAAWRRASSRATSASTRCWPQAEAGGRRVVPPRRT